MDEKEMPKSAYGAITGDAQEKDTGAPNIREKVAAAVEAAKPGAATSHIDQTPHLDETPAVPEAPKESDEEPS